MMVGTCLWFSTEIMLIKLLGFDFKKNFSWDLVVLWGRRLLKFESVLGRYDKRF